MKSFGLNTSQIKWLLDTELNVSKEEIVKRVYAAPHYRSKIVVLVMARSTLI